jgi:hypothetical protein
MAKTVVRSLIFVAATFCLGWLLDYALWALAGFPYDCNNRYDCNKLGGFLWNASWPAFIACLLIAGVVVWLVGHRLSTRRSISH